MLENIASVQFQKQNLLLRLAILLDQCQRFMQCQWMEMSITMEYMQCNGVHIVEV